MWFLLQLFWTRFWIQGESAKSLMNKFSKLKTSVSMTCNFLIATSQRASKYLHHSKCVNNCYDTQIFFFFFYHQLIVFPFLMPFILLIPFQTVNSLNSVLSWIEQVINLIIELLYSLELFSINASFMPTHVYGLLDYLYLINET